jgi:hypothetical protein
VRGYRHDFFLKLMATVQAGDQPTLDGVLRRQRAHLLQEMHSLADARSHADSAVVSLLITAAELHVRADLGVVDAAEQRLSKEVSAGKAEREQRPAPDDLSASPDATRAS